MKYLLACLIVVSSYAQGETFKIASGEFSPFCSKDSKHYGYVSHVISEAFAAVGHQVEFEFLPWKRAYELSRLGNYDASSWWAHSQERAADFIYSEPVVISRLHFFYKKGVGKPFDWQTVEDLYGRRVGITRGYHTTEEIEAAKEAGKIPFTHTNNDAQAFRMLLSGRIDIFPLNFVTGIELLRTDFSELEANQITFHPKPMSVRPGYLIFPKIQQRSDEIQAIFNKGLALIQKNGLVKQMEVKLLSGYYSSP